MAQDSPKRTLERYVARIGTRTAAARALGISHPYLYDLLKGNRPISETIRLRLGLDAPSPRKRIAPESDKRY